MGSELRDAVTPSSVGKSVVDKEVQLAKQQFAMFRRAFDGGHKEWLESSDRCDRFYRGEQWDEGTLATLEAEGRPALTINMVLSTINVVLGEQVARRMDIQYKPRKDGTQESAMALTKLAMTIADINQFAWLESSVFADGLIQDRGYFDVRMNWDDPTEGDVEITHLDPGDVIPDPDAKSYDPNDWKEVYSTRWLSLDDISADYGKEFSEKLETAATLGDTLGHESVRFKDTTFGDTSNESYYDFSGDKKELRSVRIIERQYYKNVRVYSLVDPASGKRRELPLGTTKSEAKYLADSNNVLLFPQTKRKVRWTVTADTFVLHDGWSPYDTFTIVPYFPYFRRGKPFGMVRNLLSPQEQFNKLASQELHIVNGTANSGWVVEEGALHGMTPDDLADEGSKSGIVITANPGRKDGIEKIKPNTIPTGLDRISLKAQNSIKEISGVSDALLGFESAEVSGVALESKEKRGQVQIQVPLDNLSRTRFIVARKLKELMQKFYTEERIIQFTNDLEPGQPREQMVINEVSEDGQVANDITFGDYDIVISTMPARDSMDEIQFAEALSLRNAGVQIPDYRVIQYSNLQHKDQISDEVRQLTGFGDVPPEVQEQQQRAAEAELADLEAEVEKKRAHVKELLTKADLNSAKAQEAAGTDERHQRTLEQKHAAEEEGFKVRRDLGTLTALNKLDATSLQAKLSNDRTPKDDHTSE
ncbi:MAG: hypothetical protein ACRBBW_20595 [Cellvibrionaceae bacterium]